MNFGFDPMNDKYKSFQQSWEPQYLEASRDWIFRNTFKDIEYILETLGKGHGTRFEFECYDVGHLYALAHFLDRKLVTPPLFVQSIFGILGGQGADTENLLHAKRIARSEEHTSELQSLMRLSYAALCLKKKTTHQPPPTTP